MWVDDVSDSRLVVLFMNRIKDALEKLSERSSRRISIYTYLFSPSSTWMTRRLLDAKQRGVRVCVALNLVNALSNHTARMLSSWGVKVFGSNRFLHTKVYIFDENVVISSANISNTITRWIEYGVLAKSKKLSDEIDSCLYSIINGSVGSCAASDIIDGSYVEFRAGGNMLSTIDEAISRARNRFYIMSFVASKASAVVRMLSKLSEASRKGVDVKILLNGVGKTARHNTEFAETARSKGVECALTKSFLHAKLYISDDLVIIGSQNLTASSKYGRVEAAAMIYSKKIASITSEVFNLLYRKSSQLYSVS